MNNFEKFNFEGLCSWCTSVCVLAYCNAIRRGYDRDAAIAQAHETRDVENKSSVEAGLPQLAAGSFEPVIASEWPTDWHGDIVYVSGSGTKYLVRRTRIIGRIKSDGTRSIYV